jgi:hypothetical protein
MQDEEKPEPVYPAGLFLSGLLNNRLGQVSIKTSSYREQMAMLLVMSLCRAAARHTFD